MYGMNIAEEEARAKIAAYKAVARYYNLESDKIAPKPLTPWTYPLGCGQPMMGSTGLSGQVTGGATDNFIGGTGNVTFISS